MAHLIGGLVVLAFYRTTSRIILGRVKSLYRHGYTFEAFGGKFAKINALDVVAT